jgi:hypothetical protein
MSDDGNIRTTIDNALDYRSSPDLPDNEGRALLDKLNDLFNLLERDADGNEDR